MITDVETMTEEEILKTGIRVLQEHLGTVGMLRFMQQVHPGKGDYTRDRHEYLPDDLDEIVRSNEMNRQQGRFNLDD